MTTTHFDPPHYEWSAVTVEQALSELDAARKILEAYMQTLEPGGGLVERQRLARVTPAVMVLHLNMQAVVDKIKAETEFQHVVSGVELPEIPEAGTP